MTIGSLIRRWVNNDEGATSIEYALIASLLAIGSIPVLTSTGAKLSSTFTKIASAMEDAPATPMDAPPAPAAAPPSPY